MIKFFCIFILWKNGKRNAFTPIVRLIRKANTQRMSDAHGVSDSAKPSAPVTVTTGEKQGINLYVNCKWMENMRQNKLSVSLVRRVVATVPRPGQDNFIASYE